MKGLTQDQLANFLNQVVKVFEVAHKQNLRNFQTHLPMIYIAIYLLYGKEHSTFVSEEFMNPAFIERFSNQIWWIYPPNLGEVSMDVAVEILGHIVYNVGQKLDPDLKEELYLKFNQ